MYIEKYPVKREILKLRKLCQYKRDEQIKMEKKEKSEITDLTDSRKHK